MPPQDIKKERKDLYSPAHTAPALVDAPPLQFLMIDGQGSPDDNPVYEDAIGALYSVAYTLRFALKAQGIEFVVAPLEGLWWADDPAAFALQDKARWRWTMMLWAPDAVTPAQVEAAIAQAASKKGALPQARQVRLETFHEGLSAQILHIGPYAQEGETIARLHAYIAAQGCAPAGKHHEIYLGDPRRVAPEKLKTIIRQPVQRM